MSGTNSETLVQAHHLSFKVGDSVIVDDVSLELKAGQIVTLIGPNGAGKTSLVKLLLGLLKPTSGEVIRKPDLRIGYMPQKLQLDPSLPLTVQRFLALGRHGSKDLLACAELTRITHLLKKPMYRLSGGETQRALLARALLQQPQWLVLDEPVQGVDVLGQSELYSLINKIRSERGCGVFMISHDLHLVMVNTDTVICLDKHVCCHGHPDAVTNNPAYLDLFGKPQASGVVAYTHHHNHTHDHGDGCSSHGEDHA